MGYPMHTPISEPKKEATVQQVIGAGLPMTGNASLQAALMILGFATSPNVAKLPRTPTERGRLLPILNGGLPDYRSAMGSGSSSTVDPHNCLVVPELLTAFPKAKVILSISDSPETWWASFRASAPRPGSPSYFLKHVVPALGAPNKAIWCDKHRRWVRGLVPKDRLLEYNVRDGWEPLCRFLDVPVPEEPFPWTDDALEVA